MLEQLRQSSRSFIIWILFGIIIAVFIISFGPQADQQLGCGSTNAYVLKVKDSEVSIHSWRYGNMALPVRTRSRTEKGELVMDLLVMREILAQRAEAAGFNVSTALINKRIAKGEFFVLGYPQDGTQAFFRDGFFDYKLLERVVSSVGLPSVKYFIREQRREILADYTRTLLAGGVDVSRDELLTDFRYRNTKVSLDYVKFRPAEYRRKLQLTDVQVGTYLAAHGDEVKKDYDDNAPNYKGRGKEIRARHIFLKKAPKTPKTAKTAKTPEGKTGEPEKDNAPDPAKARLEKFRKQIASGAKFDDLAAKHSEDKRSSYRGGDLGWRPERSVGWGPALTKAAKDLSPGKVSEVLETSRGYHLLQVDARREGNLTFDQVKLEIAEKLAKEYYAKEGARRDAINVLAEVKAGKKLDELFKRGAAPVRRPQFSPDQLKGLPPEVIRQLLQQQQRQKSGFVIRESANVLASMQVAPPATGSGKPVPPATGAPKPDLKPDASKPSKKPSKKKATAPDPNEVVPRPVDMPKPTVNKAGPFTRLPDTIPGLGKSEKAVVLAFEKLEEGDVADEVIEFPDGFVIFQLTERLMPNLKDFEDSVADLRRSAALQKGQAAVRTWIQAQCQDLVAKREIAYVKSYLEQQDDNGKTLPIRYRPCSQLQ